MMSFHRTFNKGVSSLEGDERIKLAPGVIEKKIDQFGRNVYFVLCCYVWGGHFVYRYVGENDELVSFFSGARAFKDAAEAVEVKNRLAAQHPHKLFDTIKFSHIEQNKS